MPQRLKAVLQLLMLFALAGCTPATPQTGMSTPIPKSMKGYELYSWNSGGIWKFKLITGTNRNKSLEEITSTEKTISDQGWVNYFVTGNAGLFGLLEQLPGGTFLIWNPAYNPGSHEIVFKYPDKATMDKVGEICKAKEIELMMPAENPLGHPTSAWRQPLIPLFAACTNTSTIFSRLISSETMR